MEVDQPSEQDPSGQTDQPSQTSTQQHGDGLLPAPNFAAAFATHAASSAASSSSSSFASLASSQSNASFPGHAARQRKPRKASTAPRHSSAAQKGAAADLLFISQHVVGEGSSNAETPEAQNGGSSKTDEASYEAAESLRAQLLSDATPHDSRLDDSVTTAPSAVTGQARTDTVGSDVDETSSSSDSEEDDADDDMDDGDDDEAAAVEDTATDTEVKAETRPPRTKNEVLPDEFPVEAPPDMTLSDDHKLDLIGTVSSVMGTTVIIQSQTGSVVLDESSILWSKGRRVFGKVFDTFGPVTQPLYMVRYPTLDEVQKRNIEVGQPVFFAPAVKDFTVYVLTQQLRRMKGTDASWMNDEEPPAEELEFSDDEEEAKAKAAKRQSKKMAKAVQLSADAQLDSHADNAEMAMRQAELSRQSQRKQNRSATNRSAKRGASATHDNNDSLTQPVEPMVAKTPAAPPTFAWFASPTPPATGQHHADTGSNPTRSSSLATDGASRMQAMLGGYGSSSEDED